MRLILVIVAAAIVTSPAGAQLSRSSQQPAAPARTADLVSPVSLQVPYTHFTLPNGLDVILHEDHSVPVVSVNIWYHVGSANERPGRTGFAHLFEHLMFEGSAHVPEGEFDSLLEAAGGNNNGSTNPDRTNYWIDIPSNALELALFLESDRMGYLLDTMSPARVDGQRDVVKNERRQSYENRPYGMAEIVLNELLYPENHPYHWPTIGYMEDLSAASYEDVVEFFKTFYAPNNASLVIAGDIVMDEARRLVEQWFGEITRGAFVEPIAPPAAVLTKVNRRTIPDRVQVPRGYLAWHTPRLFAPGDAALDVAAGVLAGGKSARLYKRLVYEQQIAQDVFASQQSAPLSSVFRVMVTARPGHSIDEILQIVDEEIETLQQGPPDAREVARVVNQIEASFYDRMERVGSYRGKADQLNAYFVATGTPDFFAEDLARYRALAPSDVQAAARRFLPRDRRVELIVMPEGTPR